jgi:hypothetical protein
MQKLYCFVDETGQDTSGRLFIVSVVVAPKERQALSGTLRAIEVETGKKKPSGQTRNRNSKLPILSGY